MKKRTYIIWSAILCAVCMSFVDGVIQPAYAVKSAVKIVLFLGVPVTFFLKYREEFGGFKRLFLPKLRDALIALALGGAVCGIIVGGYFALDGLLNITEIGRKLTADGGVNPDNFVGVSLYISLVNSFLEEFLFRGFAFITLKAHAGRKFAYIFSAAAFALYHFGMVAGSMNLLIWVLTIGALFAAGIVLNFLNEKSGNIYTSWLVHMCANIGINIVGFIIFGML